MTSNDRYKKSKTLLLLILFSCLQILLLWGCSSVDKQPKFSALDYFKRGNQFFKQHDLNAAAAEYQKAIAEDQERSEFYYNLGLVYYSMFLYDQAINEYWNAIKKQPEFADAWYNLALAFEKVDNTEEAFMAYEKYKKLNKKDLKNPERELEEQPKVLKE